MKIVNVESLFLCLTVLLVGKANAQFKFVHHDEEGNEGRNLKKEGSGWGSFGYDLCMEPVKKKLGSKLVLSNCTGTDLPTRNQQFRFTEDSDYYYEGKLQWRGNRKWCVHVQKLKGGKPLVLAPCGKNGITKWLTDTDKTWPIKKQRLCIFPRTDDDSYVGKEGDLAIVTDCDKNGGSFDFGR